MRSYDNLKNSIRAFVIFQIELYCVVDYDSEWSTKFYKDCMFEIFVI